MTVVHAVNVSTTRRQVELSCVAINTPLQYKTIRRFVPLKLTTDRHEASRGLSATAVLLVLSACITFQRVLHLACIDIM